MCLSTSAELFHFSLKFIWSCETIGRGRFIPIASDLVKLILRLERVPYLSNSLRQFESEIKGFLIENNMSSA